MHTTMIHRRQRCASDLPVVVLAVAARTVLLTVLLLVGWSVLPAALGWHVTTVVSGSMAPAIAVGDVVAAMPVDPDRITEGHVLLVDDPDRADRLRLHRVTEVLGGGSFRLRGDADPTPDRSLVRSAAVHGVGVLRFPGVGLPGFWIRTAAWEPLLGGAAVVAMLLVLARADRSIRNGASCPRCGTPRWSAEHDVARDSSRGSAHVVAVSAAVLAMALLGSSVAGASWSGSTTTSVSASSADVFPCFSSLLDDPLIAWDFGEKSGTGVRDASGHGYDGVLSVNAARVDGSCVENPHTRSTGTPHGVHGTRSMPGPMTFTAEAWFRTSEAHGRILGFGNKAGGGSSSVTRSMYVATSGVLTFGMTGATTVSSAASVADGQWHHGLATFDGTTERLWLDGVLVGSRAATAAASTGYWRAGYDNIYPNWPGAANGTQYLAGNIDSVRFYDHALDEDAVRRHVAAGR